MLAQPAADCQPPAAAVLPGCLRAVQNLRSTADGDAICSTPFPCLPSGPGLAGDGLCVRRRWHPTGQRRPQVALAGREPASLPASPRLPHGIGGRRGEPLVADPVAIASRKTRGPASSATCGSPGNRGVGRELCWNWPATGAGPRPIAPCGVYYSGQNTSGWAAVEVSPLAPRQWTVVTRDLWRDFGSFTLTGLAPTALGGEALFDRIELLRSLDSVKPGQ